MPHNPKVLETLEALNCGYLLAGEMTRTRSRTASPARGATRTSGRAAVGAGSAWLPMSAAVEA